MNSGGMARSITTTQTEQHDKLLALVERYKSSQTQKPVNGHTQSAFDDTMAWLDDWQGPVILDSCCGVGQSTAILANRFPKAKVIGLDKSAARLAKHHAYQNTAQNYRLVRADVVDFWRLAVASSCHFDAHYLLYPNPYPKPAQIQKRWYAHAVMPALMGLANTLYVRSNWQLYLQEFALASSCYGLEGELEALDSGEVMTPFEKKYMDSGQVCYQLALERQV